MTETLLLFFEDSHDIHEISICIAFYFHLYYIAIVFNLVNFEICIMMILAFFFGIYECCPFDEFMSFLCIF